MIVLTFIFILPFCNSGLSLPKPVGRGKSLVIGIKPAALNTEIGRRHGDTEIILELCFAQ